MAGVRRQDRSMVTLRVSLPRGLPPALRAAAERGLAAAGAYLVGEIKRVLSVPAPRLKGGRYAPATPGAPPRLRTGRLRRAVESYRYGPGEVRVVCPAVSAGGFPYPWYHEAVRPGYVGSGRHPFALVTARKHAKKLKDIVAREVRTARGRLR